MVFHELNLNSITDLKRDFVQTHLSCLPCLKSNVNINDRYILQLHQRIKFCIITLARRSAINPLNDLLFYIISTPASHAVSSGLFLTTLSSKYLHMLTEFLITISKQGRLFPLHCELLSVRSTAILMLMQIFPENFQRRC